MNGFAEEKFSGLATIQSYAREEQTARRFAAINDDAADAYYQATRTAKRMGPNVRFINDLGLALIAILGSLLYMRGYIGLDQISAFVLYSRKFSGPINEIANITGEIYAALAAGHSRANHKMVWSVAWFFGFQFALQFLGSLLMITLDHLGVPNFLNHLSVHWTSAESAIHAGLLMAIGVVILYGAIFYAVTTFFLKKHLNLE